MKKLLVVLGILGGVFFFGGEAHASYSYQYVGQSPHQTVPQKQTKQAKLQLKNTGTQSWLFTGLNAFHLGTSHPQDRGSGFYTGWFSPNRIALTRNLTSPANNLTIQPGETGEFEFTISPSLTSDSMGGTYREYFQPVVENVTWLPDIGLYWDWTVPAPIGVWFFSWYGPGETRWGGVADSPTLGHYDSADPNTIRAQLTQMRAAGVDFVLFDWWENLPPPGTTAHHHQAVQTLIQIINTEFPDLKYAPVVEPTLSNQITPIPQGFYDSVYATWAQSPQYLRYHGKPFMGCYLYRTCTGQDSRFSSIQFSGGPGYAYPTIKFWNAPLPDAQGDVVAPMSRFDNLYCGCAGVQRYDPFYSEGLMTNQLNWIGGRKNATRLIFFYGWNEQYERANIEPHTNPDSSVSSTYAADKLKNWKDSNWNQ